METEPRAFKVSPEDHSRGRGGFNGEWFNSPGITDVEFASEQEACETIEKRFGRYGWKRSDPDNMSGPVYTAPNGHKHLCVFPCY